jgi:purine-binding chemotaxis protein CheW
MNDDTSQKQLYKPKLFDWNRVHMQIETTRKMLEQEWTPTPEQKKKILQTRAKIFAREDKEEKEAKEYIQVVEFFLAYETYAIESTFISEVFPLKDLTPLPGTPSFVLGIANVHSEIISVLDIKKFFDLPEKGLTDLNKLIILHSENMRFGILADVIVGTHNIPLTDIQLSLPTLTGIRADYLRGVTKERVVVLDAKKLLSDKGIALYEEPSI